MNPTVMVTAERALAFLLSPFEDRFLASQGLFYFLHSLSSRSCRSGAVTVTDTRAKEQKCVSR